MQAEGGCKTPIMNLGAMDWLRQPDLSSFLCHTIDDLDDLSLILALFSYVTDERLYERNKSDLSCIQMDYI